ncbi:hypothetical protein HZH66_004706 [Vespula vulgaris]|uniref:Uncharacterized protein n=1 Tax=Vespula vulgaris TaxID=7454 RepID=A0A834NBV0_VESVU|nr:hypothetical protein HZH66_004706 [Vespula vulgaris]
MRKCYIYKRGREFNKGIVVCSEILPHFCKILPRETAQDGLTRKLKTFSLPFLFFLHHLIPWDCLELGKTILYIPGDLFSGPGMLDGPGETTKSLGMNLDAFIVLRMEGILKSIDVHVSPIYHEEISTCQEEQRSIL